MESMAYDANLGSVVLFGGVDEPGSESNDTWLWNGSNWRKIHPSTAPGVRYATNMDYDPVAKGLVLFGGFGSNQTLGDTWFFIWIPCSLYPIVYTAGLGRNSGKRPSTGGERCSWRHRFHYGSNDSAPAATSPA